MVNGNCVIECDGSIVYRLKDYGYHRIDGPAFENPDGYKAWWLYGKRHRLDGPAIEHADGSYSWYYHGKRIDCTTQEEFEHLLKLKAFW